MELARSAVYTTKTSSGWLRLTSILIEAPGTTVQWQGPFASGFLMVSTQKTVPGQNNETLNSLNKHKQAKRTRDIDRRRPGGVRSLGDSWANPWGLASSTSEQAG